MPGTDKLLKVHETGDVTIIGFVNEPYLGATQVKAMSEELADIIDKHDPKVLQFDLTGVALMTSDMLGHLLSLRKSGVDIVLYNPSEDVRQIMKTTKLDLLFDVVDESD